MSETLIVIGIGIVLGASWVGFMKFLDTKEWIKLKDNNKGE